MKNEFTTTELLGRIESARIKLNEWLEWQAREIALMPEKTMGDISRKDSALQRAKEIADIVDAM